MKEFMTKRALYLLLAVWSPIILTAQAVVWEEQFDGGPNGWTSTSLSPNDTSVWKWNATGYVGDGAFLDDDLSIDSPSGANGAMVYNADYYTTLGDPDNIPQGDPDTYPKYFAELISPPIDLSAVTSPLSLRFTQLVAFLNASPDATFQASFAWSTDGGMSWSEEVDAVAGKEINTLYNNDTQLFPIPGLSGEPDVRLRFTWSSDFYCWVIDDIQLVERPPHDMQVNDNWYAIPPNLQTPYTQVEPFGFLCDIENVGGQPQTNVNLNVTIKDDGGSTVYSGDQPYGTIGIDSLAENVSFGEFTPAPEPSPYDGVYTVSADSADVNPDNNSVEFSFGVSDSTFSKENGGTRPIYPALNNWDATEPRSWAYGNHFHVVNGEDIYANSATFAIDIPNGSTAGGQTLQVMLYEWNDLNEDTNADPDERSLVALHVYVIDGSEDYDEEITVPLTDLITGSSVALKDDTDYILCLEFITEDDSRVEFAVSDERDYGAMVLNSLQQDRPRFAGMLGIAGSLEDEPYSSLGFGRNFVPVVRLNIGEEPLFSSTKDELDPATVVQLYPNPATVEAHYRFALTAPSTQVSWQLLDLTGRVVQTEYWQNTLQQEFTVDLRQLPAGTYFLRLETDRGYSIRQLVVY